jgi:Fe-S cluster assembly ATP-binding protein
MAIAPAQAGQPVAIRAFWLCNASGRPSADGPAIHLEEVVMPLLEVKNLHVEIDGKEILKGLDLTVNAGEVHAIMGPNGSGKSTLAYVLAGKADYTPTAGEVLFDGKNIFDMAPDERAAAGLFLAFQYPLEIPGVATMTFLRTALNAQRKKRGEAELSTPEFLKKGARSRRQARYRAGHAAPRGQCRLFRRREEAQRDPANGAARAAARGARRDRFRARYRRAEDRRRRRQPAARPSRSFVVITHYQRLLNYIVPDVVHVLSNGRIVKTGGKELALELEARGYAEYQEEVPA